MSNEIKKTSDIIIKRDLETVFRNTHKEMLKIYPAQKKVIDKMLESRLKTIGVKP